MNSSNGKITLFLMTKRGAAFLKAALDKYRPLFSVVVVGRDSSLREDHADEIVSLCAQYDLRCVERAEFARVETDYALAVAWRWLINHPPERLIVFHDSLLPRYRGFSPLVNALIAGEGEVGVSAILGARDFDTGPLIAQSRSAVAYPIKIAEAIELVEGNYRACAEVVLQALLDGRPLATTAQDESLASYSLWRDEADYEIDWSCSAAKIRRLIDAVGPPYKGAFSHVDGKQVRILHAEEVADVAIEGRDYGKVLFVRDGLPIVVCGQGLLKIVDAHLEEEGRVTPFFPLAKFRMRFGR